jgi:flagellar hook-basal body complex protein FliE
MTAPVSSAFQVPQLDSIKPAGSSASPGEFQGFLNNAINGIEGLGQDASQKVTSFLAGEGEEIHSVAIAIQKADAAFDLGLQVRNKVVSAYQEIMKTQM